LKKIESVLRRAEVAKSVKSPGQQLNSPIGSSVHSRGHRDAIADN
jgi:hypothetical protein